jgi:hypothetical protein
MRKRFLAALSALLVGHGLGLAQQTRSNPDPIGREPLPVGDPAGKAPVHDGMDVQSKTFGLWASAEYLLWWTKNGRVSPLVTAGGNGALGSPGTRVLLDSLDFDNGVRHGGRFALGYYFAKNPLVGIEANYFFLAERQSSVSFSSNGDPVLAQPFINAVPRTSDATLVAAPGIADGKVDLDTRVGLWGVEANLRAGLIRSGRFRLTVLGGFRFLSLEDEVRSGEQFQVAPGVPGFGGSGVTIRDEFRTVNDFYGGQVGAEAGVLFGPLMIDFRCKLALGQMQQVADVNGATDVLNPDGSMTFFRGGLYALRSNIGHHQHDKLAFIPEVGVNVGIELTRHLKLFIGYSFLWINTVARAGEQIDPVINVSQFPIRSGDGPLVGRARPAPKFHGTDFWAQGMNFGLELSY